MIAVQFIVRITYSIGAINACLNKFFTTAKLLSIIQWKTFAIDIFFGGTANRMDTEIVMVELLVTRLIFSVVRLRPRRPRSRHRLP